MDLITIPLAWEYLYQINWTLFPIWFEIWSYLVKNHLLISNFPKSLSTLNLKRTWKICISLPLVLEHGINIMSGYSLCVQYDQMTFSFKFLHLESLPFLMTWTTIIGIILTFISCISALFTSDYSFQILLSNLSPVYINNDLYGSLISLLIFSLSILIYLLSICLFCCFHFPFYTYKSSIFYFLFVSRNVICFSNM